ncbi:MAG: glycosyltransferase family 2 protein [Elusimicrobiota bacterium]|nr:glycosyltransferase family 2 protein [Elusimicrobiota bacterium]
MTAPAFSVILPVYDRAAMVRTALATLKAQDCGDWECLAVDDGSRDGSRAVLEAEARAEPRIRVIANETNRGMNASRNEAIASAKGRFITFLDSDDLWLPGRLSAFLALSRRAPDAGYLFSNAWVLRDGRLLGTLFDPRRDIPEGVVPGHFAIGDAKLPYVTTNLAIAASAFREWGLFRTDMRTLDTELFARFLSQGLPVAALREPLSVRRLHGEQLTDRYRENFAEAMTALESGGGTPEEKDLIRRRTASEVGLYLAKACRPEEARDFLIEQLGERGARETAAWPLANLPAMALRLLKLASRSWDWVRFHPRLLSEEERAVLAYIEPLLAAEVEPGDRHPA